jgi:hypothetical protein
MNLNDLLQRRDEAKLRMETMLQRELLVAENLDEFEKAKSDFKQALQKFEDANTAYLEALRNR